MPFSLRSLVFVLVFGLLAISSSQAADRVYNDGGSVWTVSFIETKPGHFDDYIENLNQIWRRYLDE